MRSALTVLASGLLLAAASAPPAARSVHASMSQVVQPQTNAIWDVTNNAMTDAGEPDPAKIKPGDWAKLEAAGKALMEESLLLARAETITVADPGVKIMNEDVEGGTPAALVQRHIDADRAGFSAQAQKLADIGDAVARGAQAKNAGQVFEAAEGLDQACETCHMQFWYPEPATPQ